MKLHAIGGLPRSGSTLLCNILNQNPRFHASSTSCMASTIKTLSNLWSKSSEVKSDLINNTASTEERLLRTSRGVVESWYEDKSAEVVFDKGRLWNHMPLVLKHVAPESHLFVCVRDLREVFASIEKQHNKNPVLDESGFTCATVFNRVDSLFAPNGLVGQAINGVEDLCRRQLPYVHFIEFRTLVRDPHSILRAIYTAIGEEEFKHDFDNVENTADDVDGLYLNKFPHKGEGKVAVPLEHWSNYVPQDIAKLITSKFPVFNSAFNAQ